MPNKLSQFWQELKRRKVIHVTVVYASAAFVIIELVNNVYETLRLPEWTPAFTLIVLSIGFPLAIIFSRIFEISSKGLRRTESASHENSTVDSSAEQEEPTYRENSIIVLPFENISSDPEQEYFSDGLTEEVITDLSHIQDLLVISRSSAMTFKGTKKKIKEIASDVNVRYVLEGSVRKADDNIRITAQLIDAPTDTHLWAEKYSGTLHDIFSIQEKVSQSIVDALKISLSSDERNQMQIHKFDDAAAYEQYLLARNEIWRCTKESLAHAIQIIESSINTIGRNEHLLTALGYAFLQYVSVGIDPDVKNLDRADAYIDEALKLNSTLSRAHLVKSYIYETRSMAKESFESIKTAIHYDPNDAESLNMISFMYSLVGRPDLAKPFASKAVKIDPLNPLMYFGEWLFHLSEGKLELALEDVKKMYSLDNGNIASAGAYAQTLVMNNHFKEANEMFDKFIKAYPESNFAHLFRAYKYAINSDPENASQSITPHLIKAAEMDHGWAWMLAQICSMIGENDKAIDFLERATRDVFINYPFFTLYDPLLENIRGEERFKKLMEQVKYKWENFKV